MNTSNGWIKLYRCLLDDPLWQQYLRFWRELLRGNLGISISNFPAPVSRLLLNALPWTIGLLALIGGVGATIAAFRLK